MVAPMGYSLQSKREQIVASLRALVTSQSLRPERQNVCVRCGMPMQYLDATFWLYGTSSAWSVRLPFCTCEQGIHQNADCTLKDAFGARHERIGKKRLA